MFHSLEQLTDHVCKALINILVFIPEDISGSALGQGWVCISPNTLQESQPVSKWA